MFDFSLLRPCFSRSCWLVGAGLTLLLAGCQSDGKPKPLRRRPPKMPLVEMPALEGTWLNSFEENHGDTLVYRPNTYEFAPRPGRPGFAIRPYGRFTQFTPHPVAGLSRREGTWRVEGPGRVRIIFPDNMVPAEYTLSIVSLDSIKDVLEARRLP